LPEKLIRIITAAVVLHLIKDMNQTQAAADLV
jgi:hypothetical protein